MTKSEAEFANIDIPVYTGAGWYAGTYKTHLNGAQNWFSNLRSPKKLMLSGPAHLDRPFRAFHNELLRWFDHWLKGVDTRVMAEPPVRYWVMGANEWREAKDWPPPNVEWTKLHLAPWERLKPEAPVAASVDDHAAPDTFAQMPLTQTKTVQRLRYVSEPFARDTLVAGPMSLKLFASIDQDDTNFIVVISDLGPDHAPTLVQVAVQNFPWAMLLVSTGSPYSS